MRRLVLIGGIVYQIWALASAQAIRPGATVIEFDPGMYPPYWGTAFQIEKTVDGKIVAAGNFEGWVGGQYVVGLLKLDTNGVPDTGFKPALAGESGLPDARSIAIEPDGKIIVGGWFTSVNGIAATNIARLMPDGSTDPSFSANATSINTYSQINAVVRQPDGKILIGGRFDFVNGIARTNIARLNPDGSVDTTFECVDGSPNDEVFAIALCQDDRILIGGRFSALGAHTRHAIARLLADGHLDTSFGEGLPLCEGPDPVVYHILPLSDGKVLIGGCFDSVNGQTRLSLARLNSDGSLDETFVCNATYPIGEWPYATIYVCKILPDSRIVVGGQFCLLNDIPRTNVALISADGTVDTTFVPPHNWGPVCDCLTTESGGILVAGGFWNMGEHLRPMIVELTLTGQVRQEFCYGPLGLWAFNDRATIYTVAEEPTGTYLAGGYITHAQNIPVNSILRLDRYGKIDTNFVPRLMPLYEGVNSWPSVSKLLVQTNGKILVGGQFILPRTPGPNLQCIAQLNPDGSADPNFAAGLTGAGGTFPNVWDIAIQNDGKILVCGAFNAFHEIPRLNMARLNTDGSLDPWFAPMIGEEWDIVRGMALQSSGKIIVYGSFYKVNNQSRTNLARLNQDGTLDTAFSVAFAPPWFQIEAVKVQQDDKILVAGYFTAVNGVPRSGLARLNPDGSLDTSFSAGGIYTDWGEGSVSAVEIQPDGRIVIGGYFTVVNGQNRIGIARLEQDGTVDMSFGYGLSGITYYLEHQIGEIKTIKWLSNERVLVGGRFDLANNVPRSSIAMLYSKPETVVRPRLFIELTPTNRVLIKWPTNAGLWYLQQTGDLTTNTWTLVPGTPSVVGTNWVMTLPIITNQFFRLILP